MQLSSVFRWRCAAVEVLGAKQGGMPRNHDVWRDGTVPDVFVFSIIDREWPAVRSGLRQKGRSPTGHCLT